MYLHPTDYMQGGHQVLTPHTNGVFILMHSDYFPIKVRSIFASFEHGLGITL